MVNKSQETVLMQSSATSCSDTAWSVWRQDDNNNVFLVKSGLTKAAAFNLVHEYTSKGHKQIYWASENSEKTQ